MKPLPFRQIAVIGGAGYVGSALVPSLLEQGYAVKVIDLFMYGDDFFRALKSPRLSLVKADIRNEHALQQELQGCLLYTSDAADERSSVDLGGRRIIKK